MDMFKIVFIIWSIIGGSFSQIISSRILGGDSASSGTATYLVSIQDKAWVHVCAGAIIDTRWVLTSASCTLNLNIQNVVPGLTTLVDGKMPTNSYHISRATPHPDYIEGEPFNNIGIIRTLQTFVYSTTIRYLPWSTSTLGASQTLTIVGWDLSSKAATDSSTTAPGTEGTDPSTEEPALRTAAAVTSYRLKSLTLTSLTNVQCEKDVLSGTIVEPSHLCGLRSAGKGTCVGDDGLVVVSGGRIQGIVGNVPATVAECALGYPEVFTRVSSFSSWISAERAKSS